MKGKRVTKRANFVSPNEKAKSAVVAQLVRIARKARLGYDDFLYISQQARKKFGLRRGRKERRLPQLLADADLDACMILINRGKGGNDRCILFPASFRLVLKSHLHAAPR